MKREVNITIHGDICDEAVMPIADAVARTDFWARCGSEPVALPPRMHDEAELIVTVTVGVEIHPSHFG